MADSGRTTFGGSAGLEILAFPVDYCYVYTDGGEKALTAGQQAGLVNWPDPETNLIVDTIQPWATFNDTQQGFDITESGLYIIVGSASFSGSGEGQQRYGWIQGGGPITAYGTPTIFDTVNVMAFCPVKVGSSDSGHVRLRFQSAAADDVVNYAEIYVFRVAGPLA